MGSEIFITPPSDYLFVIDKTFDEDYVKTEGGVIVPELESDAELDEEFQKYEVYSVGPLVTEVKPGDTITVHRSTSFRTLKEKVYPLVNNKLLNIGGVHLLRLNIIDVKFVE